MCIRNLKEKFPKIKYISIGDGDEKKRLLSLVKELKLEKEVIFLNNIDQKLKISLIQKFKSIFNAININTKDL